MNIEAIYKNDILRKVVKDSQITVFYDIFISGNDTYIETGAPINSSSLAYILSILRRKYNYKLIYSGKNIKHVYKVVPNDDK